MIRGESVKPIVDYDLFGLNVNDVAGIYLKTDEKTNKCLIYFPVNGEWGELDRDSIVREDPGVVPTANKDFIENVKPMVITYPTG